MSEKNSAKLETVELPNALKAKLVCLARRLPESGRKEFVQRVSQRVGEVVADHPNTLVFSVLGTVLGFALDRMLTIHLPLVGLTLELTGGKGVYLGFFGGTLYGLSKDRGVEHKIRAIIASELQRAMGPSLGAATP